MDDEVKHAAAKVDDALKKLITCGTDKWQYFNLQKFMELISNTMIH